jgi:hypothetical protein
MAYDSTYYTSNKAKCSLANKKWRATQPRYYIDQSVKWHTKHPSYVNWDKMKQRVTDPNNNRYTSYGGRKITIYPPWLDFSTYEKEFGYSKPGPGYTVDRIDNDGNYEPGNVQWLTKDEHTRKTKTKDN